MPIDLGQHAAALGGDPAAFFVEEEGRALPVVVEHATGRVRFVVADGQLRPYEPPASGTTRAGIVVENPPDFRGFPAHDRGHPAYRVEAHGLDPAEHFVHFEAEHPLVVEHATGRPIGRIRGGKLEKFGAGRE